MRVKSALEKHVRSAVSSAHSQHAGFTSAIRQSASPASIKKGGVQKMPDALLIQTPTMANFKASYGIPNPKQAGGKTSKSSSRFQPGNH